MPKVSVIVPVYNVEPYLRECMDSIVRQTLKDIEIICVNDGSTDGSPEILKEYAGRDSRIVLVNKENGGYGMAMNIGLDRATGEYVGIVEPDDYVALTMYEDLYNAAREYDLDLVKADFYRFCTDEGGISLRYTRLWRKPEDYGTVFKPLERLDSFLYVMNTWSGIYRLAFLREKGIRHNETPGASFQDNGFWFQTFMYAERAMILAKPYYRVRRDNPNSSIRNPAKVYAMNVEYDHIRSLIERDPEMWEKLKGTYWLKRYHNYLGTLRRIDPSFTKEYRSRVAEELKKGFAAGEFTSADFGESWPKVEALMEGRKLPLKADAADVTEMSLILNSRSYKIGRMITWLPRKLRALAGKGGTI